MDDRAGKVDKELQEIVSPDKIWLYSGDLDLSLHLSVDHHYSFEFIYVEGIPSSAITLSVTKIECSFGRQKTFPSREGPLSVIKSSNILRKLLADRVWP